MRVDVGDTVMITTQTLGVYKSEYDSKGAIGTVIGLAFHMPLVSAPYLISAPCQRTGVVREYTYSADEFELYDPKIPECDSSAVGEFIDEF